MSNNEETWQPRTPTDGEYNFEGWLYWETKLGEFGNPGFMETTELMKMPQVFGSEEPRTIYMTTYRQDGDGLLLGILLRYYDDAGVRHPLLYLVHPDHRGKGIGTRMVLYQEEKFINEEASPGLKRGGVLNIVRHELELICEADKIPDEIEIDVTGYDVGDAIHISVVTLPEGSKSAITDRDFTIATIVAPSGLKSKEGDTTKDDGEGE